MSKSECEFGRCLRRFRTERKFSLRKLAKRAGMFHSNVSAMEGGRIPVGPNAANRLANALRLPATDRKQFLLLAASCATRRRISRENVDYSARIRNLVGDFARRAGVSPKDRGVAEASKAVLTDRAIFFPVGTGHTSRFIEIVLGKWLVSRLEGEHFQIGSISEPRLSETHHTDPNATANLITVCTGCAKREPLLPKVVRQVEKRRDRGAPLVVFLGEGRQALVDCEIEFFEKVKGGE